jgi:GST-like protein
MGTHYTPPKVWNFNEKSGGAWAKVNRPISGATYDAALPVGNNPHQLYSIATPNGQKITIMFEELLALGIKEAEYDAHMIEIGQGDQFSSGFVEANPNSKIPVLVDHSIEGTPVRVFESGAILLYLADKFSSLLPKDTAERTEALNWLFWLQGSAPYLGGGFGHFYVYAPEKFEYPINRFTMEVKRQLHLLDQQLSSHPYIAGDYYSITDIAIWPWYGNLVLGNNYDAAEFLDVTSYPHLLDWAKRIEQRPAVQRGRIVNRTWGQPWEQLTNRYQASDIDQVLSLKP